MNVKDMARILTKRDGKKVIHIPSFELDIFEGDLEYIEKKFRKTEKELKLMTVNASALQNRVEKLEKKNKELAQSLAKQSGVLVEKDPLDEIFVDSHKKNNRRKFSPKGHA